MNKINKAWSKVWPWISFSVGFLLTIFDKAICTWLVKNGFEQNDAEHFIWFLSVLFVFSPCVIIMKEFISTTKEIKVKAIGLSQKYNDLLVWKNNEREDKICITVSDLDDYLILLPLHLSIRRFFKGLNVQIITRCCGSDKKAIEALLTGESNFAITDPHYLQDYKDKDLVFLAPLITQTPMWWMMKGGSPEPKNKNIKIKIFSYETDNNQSSTSTGRLLKNKLAEFKRLGIKVEVKIIKNVVEELLSKLRNIDLDSRNDTLIGNYTTISGEKGLDGLKKDKDKISAFDCLLFSCKEKNETIQKIVSQYFLTFDYFLVTEPDCSFIKNALGYKANAIEETVNGAVFTGIISTRQYLREYPVASLKMLRGLREGILMSNILFMNHDTDTIKYAFTEALKAASKEQTAILFDAALGNIQDFELSASFFPNDLILLGVDKLDEIYRKYYNSTRYGNVILTSTGSHADIDDKNIKFLLKGLGYDCK